MKPGTADPDASQLRRNLADELEANGDLRNPPWRMAVERVPREAFLGERVYRRVDTPAGTLWEPATPAAIGQAKWLELANQNTTLVTQIDASDQTGEGPVQGAPTSSSTLPGLVIRMLEDLDPHPGHTVLEIGTGTGYSTALLCERLGDARVISMEVDQGIAVRAERALASVGYHPTLVTGDGLAGHAARAPYDRIIAACSVRSIPPEWMTQARPGGRILVTLSSWLYGSGLVALETNGNEAHGHFLTGTVSFMPARGHAAPPLSRLFPAREGDTRVTACGADILGDWMGRFLAGLAAPAAQHAHLSGGGDSPATDFITEQATGSHAWLTRADGTWIVQQHGPTRLWDQIEQTYDIWRQAGQPPQQDFTLHVTPHGQIVRLTAPRGTHDWPLPHMASMDR